MLLWAARDPSCGPLCVCPHRYFETDEFCGIPGQWWFGGGTDITPCYVVEEDMKHFHGTYKKVRAAGPAPATSHAARPRPLQLACNISWQR